MNCLVGMIFSNDFCMGIMIEIDGVVWCVVEFLYVKFGKGFVFVCIKFKVVKFGNVVEKIFCVGEMFF